MSKDTAMKVFMIVVVLLAATCLVITTIMLIKAFNPQDTLQETTSRTISVSATGTIKYTPDTASFSVGMSELADTTAQAQQLVNEKMAYILATLRSDGVEDKDISTTTLTLRPEYNWIDGKQTLMGQRATQKVSVTLQDIDKRPTRLGALVDKLGQASGLEFSSVQFDLADKDAVNEQARLQAVEKAQEKAQLYANATDMVLTGPISINEQGLSYSTQRNTMYLMSAAPAPAPAYETDVPTGEMEVTSSVSIVFQMERKQDR